MKNGYPGGAAPDSLTLMRVFILRPIVLNDIFAATLRVSLSFHFPLFILHRLDKGEIDHRPVAEDHEDRGNNA